MNTQAMTPQAMKQVNMATIRNTLRAIGSATRAQLAEKINVSTTTVRSLLCEMQENGEILVTGQDASSGGRRAERYQLNPQRFCGAAFCIGDGIVSYHILNLFGQIMQGEDRFPYNPTTMEDHMAEVLETRFAPDTLRAVCIGVPGVVTPGGYARKCDPHNWEEVLLGEKLRKRFDVPIVLENNLNLITAGMGHCHRQKFPQEAAETLNMALLYCEPDGISAGFLSGGRLVRGFSNYSGELGLMPANGGLTLGQQMRAAKSDREYAEFAATIVKWIVLVLNPQYISFGGPSFRKNAMGIISDILYADMPHDALPELLFAPDTRHDYDEGLAALCTDHIFLTVNQITP